MNYIQNSVFISMSLIFCLLIEISVSNFFNSCRVLIWKKQVERESRYMYVRQEGNTNSKNGDKIFHYYWNGEEVWKRWNLKDH